MLFSFEKIFTDILKIYELAYIGNKISTYNHNLSS